MDRRNFLKRTAGTLVAAPFVKWKAPERPPEIGHETTVEAFGKKVKVEELRSDPEPTWWAKVRIEGMGYRMAEFNGPRYDNVVYDDVVTSAAIKRLIPGRIRIQLDMVLWANDANREHAMGLVKTVRDFTAYISVPNQIAFEASGFVTDVHVQGDVDRFPVMSMTMELRDHPRMTHLAVDGG